MGSLAMLAIREMAVEDLPQARKLLAQLGYDLGPAEVKRRYDAIVKAEGHSLFEAEHNEQVIGLLHLYARPALDKPPEIIVQALVVDDAARGNGVGRALMDEAERYARRQGFVSMALTSHVARSQAHAFYERLSYRIEATSHLMRKKLA